jgi:hypothetical protein
VYVPPVPHFVVFPDELCSDVPSCALSVILILETFHMKKPENNGMTGSTLYIDCFFIHALPAYCRSEMLFFENENYSRTVGKTCVRSGGKALGITINCTALHDEYALLRHLNAAAVRLFVLTRVLPIIAPLFRINSLFSFTPTRELSLSASPTSVTPSSVRLRLLSPPMLIRRPTL